jgi:hypothetical protein
MAPNSGSCVDDLNSVKSIIPRALQRLRGDSSETADHLKAIVKQISKLFEFVEDEQIPVGASLPHPEPKLSPQLSPLNTSILKRKVKSDIRKAPKTQQSPSPP